jgi:hypothetical protein
MQLYRMTPDLSKASTVLHGYGNPLAILKSGAPMKRFTPPMTCYIPEKFKDGKLSSFYITPGVIIRKDLVDLLVSNGITNLEVFPCVIENRAYKKEYNEWVLLNILGTRSIKDKDLDGEYMIDTLTLPKDFKNKDHLFLIREDTDCIVVSEKVRTLILEYGFGDICFKKL